MSIIHFHIDLLQFPLVEAFESCALTTLHGRLDLPDLKPFYAIFSDSFLVSISNSQRSQLPSAGWVETGYHGLPHNLHPLSSTCGDYLGVCHISEFYLLLLPPQRDSGHAIPMT